MVTIQLRLILALVVASTFLGAVYAQPGKTVIELNATVFGPNGFRSDLKKEDFDILFDKIRGRVDIATIDDRPASILILLDVSTSMRSADRTKLSKFRILTQGFEDFLKGANSENEYLVATYDDSLTTALDWTTNGESLKAKLGELQKQQVGNIHRRYFDAVRYSFDRLAAAKFKKRVILLLTDAFESGRSKSRREEIERIARENHVLIYAVRPISTIFATDEKEVELAMRQIPLKNRDAPDVVTSIDRISSVTVSPLGVSIRSLENLCTLTGGRGYFPLDENESAAAFALIADELRSQYRLVVDPDLTLRHDVIYKIKASTRNAGKNTNVRVRKEISLPNR